ncbi:glycosyltransferase family 25 protein [Acuticoccus sp. M5D2P5]|uniref:glycosyltransferase family 25 protein n=1 Tax=Acuticoccus kalidii TaxID=2910977 RepID=UPI001F39394B|nr:glycosyltransferase family 25 protein [Acuticoccus kalidii]MCF3934435.1 glycosyltransferase family 25 protein [Acuticoccus kalidii]
MVRAVVISRLTDARRRRYIEETVPANWTWSFLDAVDGFAPETIAADLHSLVAPTFWGNPRLKPGAIGCFLSHYRAWEMCAAGTSPLVVFEDDIAVGPNQDLNAAVDGALSGGDADVVFVNRSVVRWREQFFAETMATQPPVAALAVVVEGLVSAGGVPRPNGPGGYGYVLTPAGAETLCALAQRVGTVIGVDWFLVAAGIAGTDLADGEWKTPAHAVRCLGGVDMPLRVGIAADWLVGRNNVKAGDSVIEHGNAVDAAAYRERLGQECAAD